MTTLLEGAIEVAEQLESPKAKKARKRAEKKANRESRLADMKAKLEANDAKLLESFAALRGDAVQLGETIDGMIAAAFNPATPAKILAALKDSAFVGRVTRFDCLRLQAAYVQGLIVSAMREKAAIVDPDDKERSVKIREAAEDAKLEASKALGIYRKLSSKQSADDLKKLSTKAREAVTRLAQAGKLFERFGWLRPMAEGTNRELGALCVYILAPFAAFDAKSQAWIVVHPRRQQDLTEKAKRNGDKAQLTTEEESKLRGLVQSFADGELNEPQLKAALVAAGFRKQAEKRNSDPHPESGEPKSGEGASGSRATMDVSYPKLGENATAAQALEFISGWWKENHGKDKAATIGLVSFIAKSAREAGLMA